MCCFCTHIAVFYIKVLDGCLVRGSEKTHILPITRIDAHQTAYRMTLPVEVTHEVIVGSCSILSDRCPQLIAAFIIFQTCAFIVDNIVVERDVVGKYEILALIFRIVIRHHIGKVGKMLGGLNPVGIGPGTVTTAKKSPRLACRIFPILRRKTYTMPTRHKQQNKGHNDKM